MFPGTHLITGLVQNLNLSTVSAYKHLSFTLWRQNVMVSSCRKSSETLGNLRNDSKQFWRWLAISHYSRELCKMWYGRLHAFVKHFANAHWEGVQWFLFRKVRLSTCLTTPTKRDVLPRFEKDKLGGHLKLSQDFAQSFLNESVASGVPLWFLRLPYRFKLKTCLVNLGLTIPN